MGDFVEQLRLAEKAAEDIYFAKVSRELIVSLHRRSTARLSSSLVQTSILVVSVKEEEKCQ